MTLDLYTSICVWTVGIAGVLTIGAIVVIMLASAANIIRRLTVKDAPLPTTAVVTEAVVEQPLLPPRRMRRAHINRCEKCRNELSETPTGSEITDNATILQYKCVKCNHVNMKLATGS